MSFSRPWLVFEPQTGGHRGDYVRWLLAGLRRNGRPIRIRFVLAHGILQEDGGLAPEIAAAPHGVEFVEIPEETDRKQWPALLKKAISDAAPEHLLLFELTPWENWLSCHRLGVPISGILFVQYPELDWSCGPWSRRVGRWMRFRFKEWKTARWLKRQDWRSVFLFNGERACEYLNRRFGHTPVFRPIPDPAPLEGAAAGGPASLPVPRVRSEEEVRFLFPGTLSRRKGAEVLLKALGRVSSETAKRSVYILAGQAEARDRKALEDRVARLRRRRPDIRLEWDDRFLPEPELQDRMWRSDWILAPYLRTEYSSGIFARAASAGIPILGPADGLLGRLIREWGLGRTAETTPAAWAKALENAVGSPMTMDESKRWAFLRRSRAEDFARQLLGG